MLLPAKRHTSNGDTTIFNENDLNYDRSNDNYNKEAVIKETFENIELINT